MLVENYAKYANSELPVLREGLQAVCECLAAAEDHRQAHVRYNLWNFVNRASILRGSVFAFVLFVFHHPVLDQRNEWKYLSEVKMLGRPLRSWHHSIWDAQKENNDMIMMWTCMHLCWSCVHFVVAGPDNRCQTCGKYHCNLNINYLCTPLLTCPVCHLFAVWLGITNWNSGHPPSNTLWKSVSSCQG